MLLWIILLGLHFGKVYGGTCTEAYACPKTCYTKTKYYTACGLFNWERCTKHKTRSYSCTKTCYRTVCCKGYTGNGCDTPICFGSTSCPNGGRCVSPDSCRCPPGFSSPQCNDINECYGNAHECQHSCVNTNGSYHCACRSGYTLDSDLKSCLDANECNTDNGECEQICNNNKGSYTCDCRSGYNLNADGKNCSDMNECNLGSAGCAHACNNTVGSYTCSCHTGYVLAIDGKKCEDIDECSEGSHECVDSCQNTPGSYTCYCGTGFELGSDGFTCQDVDECSVSNGNCDQICRNQPGSYMCNCQIGYRMKDDVVAGNECQDIDECTEQTSGCTQICNNINGSYTCSCNNGYFLDSDDKTCIGAEKCKNIICHNGGTCTEGFDSFICECEAGFTGMRCQTDINECEIYNGGCQDICINTIGSFECKCSDGRRTENDGFSCTTEEDITVFDRLKIYRQLLPEACFTVMLVRCTDGNEIDVYLTSTSEWYRLNSDANVIYTLGIVFVKVNTLSVPVSLGGIEVTLRNKEFALNYGVQYVSAEGKVVENDLTSSDCQSVELVDSDFFDFIKKDSFTKTLLFALFPAIPDWLQFEKSKTEILSVQDVKTDLVYGRNMDDIIWCAGAPVLAGHLYTVFRFGTGFIISVLGNEVDVPKPLKSRKFCLIVDLCQSNGGTAFLMIPEESRDFVQDLNIFRSLKETLNIHIEPRGVGMSLVSGIYAGYNTFSHPLWNGDSMFIPPNLPQVDFWIGGKMVLPTENIIFEGNADIYLKTPTIQTMLMSMYREEWRGTVDIQVSPVLRFELFGKEYLVPLQFVIASVNAFISVGGSDRQWCGEVSNPQGVFLSAMVEINPFVGVPFLEDFVFSFTNRLYVLLTTDPNVNSQREININIRDDILGLNNLLNGTLGILDVAVDDFNLALSDSMKGTVLEIRETVIRMQNINKINLYNLSLSRNFEEKIHYHEDIRQESHQLRDVVNTFIDKTKVIVNEAKTNFTELLKSHTTIIRESINHISNSITQKLISTFKKYSGFGLKFSSSLKVFGMLLYSVDFELVYSEGDLFRCSRFEEIRILLEGEHAIRFIGRFSRGYALGYFLKQEKGFGIGGALATRSVKVAIQLQVFVKILGISITIDMFISTNGIYFYLEGNVWDIFLAQIDVSAAVGRVDWYHLTFNLRGRFVAKSRKKRFVQAMTMSLKDKYLHIFKNARKVRQVQTVSSSFQDSYLDALNRATRMISEDAQNRLSQAQSALSASQRGLTKAQNWFDVKKVAVRKVNVEIDNAIKKLEVEKGKFEAAKGPANEAIKKLQDAQRDVDNLCKIRTCRKLCLPGIKLKTCHKKVWGGKISFPCLKYTSCMISFPDPFCVLTNVACSIVRGIAYIALENAKLFVRSALLTFDVAKSAFTVAQLVVDTSRFALTVAEGILEAAEIGLEIAKQIQEAAKVALEVVKRVIGAAAKVLELVIHYGLQSIIDVRNCGFNIELSTKDLQVFEVYCEVNAFRLGWIEFKFKINFKNALQSIWQAARATIKAVMDIIEGSFGERERRDIEFDALSRMHVLLRNIRESNGLNNTDTYLNETIDIVNNITGFRYSSDSDSQNRIEIFREKCSRITVIQDFIKFAFESLQDIVNESKGYILEMDNVKKQIRGFSDINGWAENITVETVGINNEYALKAFNMTDDDLDKAINETKSDGTNDPSFVAIQSVANISEESLNAQRKAIELVDYRSAWFTSMVNISRDYFLNNECADFRDCVFFSVSSLYDLYEAETVPNLTSIEESILNLENTLVDIFQNESSSILETSVAIEYILSHINNLIEMNSFCAEPPTFLTKLKNQTVFYGSDVSFLCNVADGQEVTYTWMKNDTVVAGENLKTINIVNITYQDTYDKYNCIAGNVVANITSDDAYIAVVLEEELKCKAYNGTCQHLCNKKDRSYVCLCYEGYEIHERNRSLGIEVSEKSVSSSIRLFLGNDTVISNPMLCVAIAKMLKRHFEALTDRILPVYVNSLRLGSVIADYTVVYEDDQNANTVGDALVKGVIELAAGSTLLFDGNPVQAQSILPANYTDLCHIRVLLAGKCEDGWYCKVENSIPYCRMQFDESQSGDYIHIVAPALGSLAFVIVVLTVCGVYFKNRRRYWPARASNNATAAEKDDDFAYVNRAGLVVNDTKSVPSNTSKDPENIQSKMQDDKVDDLS